MTVLTLDDIERIVGPVDQPTRAQLLRTGATAEELREAFAWLEADEAMADQHRPLPKGRVAELIAILEPPEPDVR
ncbi:MAG: hypothetical protein ACOC3D_10950 [Pseudomonadota bacterium]